MKVFENCSLKVKQITRVLAIMAVLILDAAAATMLKFWTLMKKHDWEDFVAPKSRLKLSGLSERNPYTGIDIGT